MLIVKMSNIINAKKDCIVLCLYKYCLNQLIVKVGKNIFGQAFSKFNRVNFFISHGKPDKPLFYNSKILV